MRKIDQAVGLSSYLSEEDEEGEELDGLGEYPENVDPTEGPCNHDLLPPLQRQLGEAVEEGEVRGDAQAAAQEESPDPRRQRPKRHPQEPEPRVFQPLAYQPSHLHTYTYI